jgi:ankyrin repeat protein
LMLKLRTLHASDAAILEHLLSQELRLLINCGQGTTLMTRQLDTFLSDLLLAFENSTLADLVSKELFISETLQQNPEAGYLTKSVVHLAVLTQNPDFVDTVLQAIGPAGIQSAFQSDFTPLHLASEMASERIVQQLLCAAPESLGIRGPGYTALERACTLQNLQAMRPLLAAYPKAALAKGNQGKSLVRHAVRSFKSKAALELMLELVPSAAQEREKPGRESLLHLAVRHHNAAAVEALLISHPTLAYARDRRGQIPFQLALQPIKLLDRMPDSMAIIIAFCRHRAAPEILWWLNELEVMAFAPLVYATATAMYRR